MAITSLDLCAKEIEIDMPAKGDVNQVTASLCRHLKALFWRKNLYAGKRMHYSGENLSMPA